MNTRIDNIIIRGADGPRFANSLVLGTGLRVAETAGGVPELAGIAGEAWLAPSGADDTARIRAALAGEGVRQLRLGPGSFSISDRITLQPGQILAGTGTEQTTITGTTQFVEMLSGSAVESLTLDGLYITGAAPWTWAAGMRVDRVRILNAEFGIEGTGGSWQVTRSSFENLSSFAIRLSGIGARISEVTLVGCAGGMVLQNFGNCHLSALVFTQCGGGIRVDNSRCIVVDSTGLFDCGAGLTITNSKALSLSATRVAGCLAGFRLENSIGSTVSGCFVGRHVTSGPSARSPLEIVGGSALTISGFQSEMTGAGAGSPPHVLVTGGATEVMFTSIRRINGTTAPAVELDVAGAGGRVLFAQQNFDPARINSGGKFVAL